MTVSAERLAVALADRYRIEREFGQGGTDVAIRVLHPDLGGAHR